MKRIKPSVEYRNTDPEEARQALKKTISTLCEDIMEQEDRRNKRKILMLILFSMLTLFLGYILGYHVANQNCTVIISPIP